MKVDPIHIFMDEHFKPTQQKQRKVALHYMEKLRRHVDELKSYGIVLEPLGSENATGWISNPVIMGKQWDSD